MARIIPICKLGLLAALAVLPGAACARAPQPDPLSRYAEGRMADASGNVELAARAYGDALTSNPRDGRIALLAFRQAVEAGDRRLASRAANTLASLNALTSDSRLMLIVDALTKGDWREAEARLDELAAGDSFAFLGPVLRGWALYGAGKGDPMAALDGRMSDPLAAGFARDNRGLLLLAMKQAEAGSDTVKAAQGRDGRWLQLRLAAASQLVALKRIDLATGLLQGNEPPLAEVRALVASGKPLPDPVRTAAAGSAILFAQVASALLGEQAPQSALLMARLASFAQPDNGYARLQLARALIASQREDDALAVLAPLDAHPFQSGFATDLRLNALIASDRSEEAVALAKAGTAARPDAAASWLRLGDVLAQDQKHGEAADAFERAIAVLQSAGPDARVGWGIWLAAGRERNLAGDWPRAKALLQKAVAAAPDEAGALNHLGYSMLEARDNVTEAMALIARASNLRPSDPAITDSLGWAFFQLGQADKAIPLLERALALDPTIGEISDHLGDAYWAVGRKVDARYAWSAALVQAEGEEAERIKVKLERGPAKR